MINFFQDQDDMKSSQLNIKLYGEDSIESSPQSLSLHKFFFHKCCDDF